jgi:hypothetical protein
MCILVYLPEWVWQSNQVQVLHKSLIMRHQLTPFMLCHDGAMP